jgi:hypothetical protein
MPYSINVKARSGIFKDNLYSNGKEESERWKNE